MRSVLPALLLLLAAEAEAGELMKGMTVSCPGYGKIWGSPAMRYSVRELKELGVEWIAIHPYASVRTDGSIRFQDPANTGYMQRAVSITRSEGLEVFWKPHLAYWGSFEWRGAIRFDDDAAWGRFFSGYERFIVAHARFAEEKKIPLLAIGTEYEKTMQHEAAWRRIIGAVRKVYSGKITYAANWDGIDRVPFWDAVDLIGVQAYFPLSDGEGPSQKELDARWDRLLARLTSLSEKHGDKKILLTEIGYPRSMGAAREPWKPAVDGSDAAIALRTGLLDTALRKLDHPRIAGAFWWKWIPGSTLWDQDFSMRDEEARRALGRHWSK